MTREKRVGMVFHALQSVSKDSEEWKELLRGWSSLRGRQSVGAEAAEAAEAGRVESLQRLKHRAEELQLCPMDTGSHGWF